MSMYAEARHTAADDRRRSPEVQSGAYEAVLDALGRWLIYHDASDQEPRGHLRHALTRLKPGSRITGEHAFGGFTVPLDFETHDGDLIAGLTDALRRQGFPLSQAENPQLLSRIIAAHPDALAERDCWVQKQANGKGAVYDPACGDGLRIGCGRDFPNAFYSERFTWEAAELWQQLASPVSPFSQFNTAHVAIQPILDRPQPDAQGRYTVHSRFCGKSISEMIDACGRAQARCKAWREKPQGLNIPPREIMLRCVVLEALDQGGLRFADKRPLSDLAELAVYPRCLTGAQRLARIEAHLDELDTLPRSSALGKAEVDLVFVAMLLLKGLYLDEALRQVGVAHSHLHEGNITWEAVRRGDTGLHISGRAVLFDAPSYRTAPEGDYVLVTRMIDLAAIRRQR